MLFAAGSEGQQARRRNRAQGREARQAGEEVRGARTQMVLEPRAIEILKAASARLAAAKSMAFTAVVSYESPSRLGPPLVYATKSEVTLQRPDKLKVISLGDGPPSEFYYDGKVMMAFAPTENLVAVADAPPTIDAALQAAYDSAAIYFPFTDVIVADPYKDIADGLKVAFYIGQSNIVGGTTTDMVAYVTGDVFVQIWIGARGQASAPRLRRVSHRSRAAASRAGALQLATGRRRSRGRVRFGQGQRRGAHGVRAAGREGCARNEAAAEGQGAAAKAQPVKTQ